MRGSIKMALVLVAVALCAAACGSGGHPDTGAGAGETPPAIETCVGLCQRLGECVATLCDEDTASSHYTGLADLLANQCEATCTDAEVASRVSATAWACIFQSSCRQVFDDDVCHGMAHYSCM